MIFSKNVIIFETKLLTIKNQKIHSKETKSDKKLIKLILLLLIILKKNKI